MLEAKDIQKCYMDRTGRSCEAVCGVTFTLPERKIYALVGESGCGKSTLSRILTGLEPPTGGQVLLDGHPLSRRGKTNRLKTCAAVQLVLQDGKSAMDPRFSVYQTIAEPMRYLLYMTKEQEHLRVFELLKRLELPSETAQKKAGELSGGQQKRVCIARALAASPRYIIFDEAISGLDVVLRKTILELLLKIQKEEQCGYLFITHEVEAALYLSNSILVMQNGVIVEQCEWNGGIHCFKHSYTKQLLQAARLI